MKNVIITGVMVATMVLVGCGKENSSPNNSTPPVTPQATAASSPIAAPALTAWQQNDTTAAISSFLEANWSARPLFATNSTLNLSEEQFTSLSNTERKVKSSEILPQLDALKQLAAAVAQAGRDAAAKGDVAQAKKYFSSLNQCGTALDTSESLQLVRLVGQALKKLSDKEMTKLGK